MTNPRSIKRIVCWVGAIILVALGLVLIHQVPLATARPPKNLKTVEDFQAWKRGAIIGKGTFERSGVTYTVMLAPAGRYLASGPSAYLFDKNGHFVDWTADMGDFYTVKNYYNLTSGNVKNIEYEKP